MSERKEPLKEALAKLQYAAELVESSAELLQEGFDAMEEKASEWEDKESDAAQERAEELRDRWSGIEEAISNLEELGESLNEAVSAVEEAEDVSVPKKLEKAIRAGLEPEKKETVNWMPVCTVCGNVTTRKKLEKIGYRNRFVFTCVICGWETSKPEQEYRQILEEVKAGRTTQPVAEANTYTPTWSCPTCNAEVRYRIEKAGGYRKRMSGTCKNCGKQVSKRLEEHQVEIKAKRAVMSGEAK